MNDTGHSSSLEVAMLLTRHTLRHAFVNALHEGVVEPVTCGRRVTADGVLRAVTEKSRNQQSG